jgi:hypothetical protein
MANFTFEMWFRANPTGATFRTLLDNGGSNPYLFNIYTKLNIYLDGIHLFEPGPSVIDGIWHHFALTGAGSVVTCYLDGQPIATGTYGNPMNSSSADLYIGAAYGGGPFYDHFSGAIDEVRIWNVARTAAQIEANRLYVLNGSELGLVAYYRFDTPGQVITNLATSTGSSLDGTLGPDANVNSEDPTFTTTDFPPMFYCVSGTGQPNSNEARLEMNGLGTGTTPGPFSVSALAGSPLVLSWSGPANRPFVLASGHLNTNNINFGCTGKVDIGTPPFFGDLGIFLNGLAYPGNLLYVLSSSGAATQSFTLPQIAVGLSATFQGLVIQPPGACSSVLTAAFQVVIS